MIDSKVNPGVGKLDFQGLAQPSLLPMALWFGFVSGLLELLVLAGQDAYHLRVTVDSIRINHHYLWMVPISSLIIVGTCGLVLSGLSRFRRPVVAKFALYLFCFLTCFIPLLAIRGMYSAASLILAAGVASQLAPFLKARPQGFRRLMRFSLPIMVVVVVGLVGFKGSQVVLAERRALAELPAAKPDAPNVLFIVMDNVRADHLSLYGYHRETTPNLTRLAKRGIRFDFARAPAPWTLPSHASMFTGQWPHQLSTTIDKPLDDTYPTLAEFLTDQGYVTAGFVANTYYCNAWYGLDRGFSRYEDFDENVAVSPLEIFRSSELGGRIVEFAGVELETPGEKESRKSAEMINNDVLEWLAARKGRPYFAFLNYYDAHAPFDPPGGSPRRFGLSALDEPSRRAIAKRFRAMSRKGILREAGPARTDTEISRDASLLLADSYDDCIAYLDEQIGKLFDNLELQGLLRNTIVVITSDHGEHFGDRGLFGHGHSLYRPLIDVPLLVMLPNGNTSVETINTINNVVSLRDLPATVVDLLGLASQSPFPGSSLARHWQTEKLAELTESDPPLSHVEHQPLLTPAPHIPASLGPLWSIANQNHVYIRNGDGREELYHCKDDPTEIHNLADKGTEPTVIQHFRETMDRLLSDRPFPRQKKRVRRSIPTRLQLCGMTRTKRGNRKKPRIS